MIFFFAGSCFAQLMSLFKRNRLSLNCRHECFGPVERALLLLLLNMQQKATKRVLICAAQAQMQCKTSMSSETQTTSPWQQTKHCRFKKWERNLYCINSLVCLFWRKDDEFKWFYFITSISKYTFSKSHIWLKKKKNPCIMWMSSLQIMSLPAGQRLIFISRTTLCWFDRSL